VEEKEVKKNWTVGSARSTRLTSSSKLSVMSRSARNSRSARRSGSAREGPRGEAQCALIAQRRAKCKVSLKSKLPQAYKRSKKLKEKTH